MRWRRLVTAAFGIVAASILCARAAGPPTPAVQLTPTERQWLQDHPVIRLAPDPDFQPIEYFDQTGAYQGAAADIVRLLEEDLGVKFTIVRLKNWDEVMDRFKNREVDLLGAIVQTPNRERFALFTDTLLTVPGGIFTRDTHSAPLTLKDLKGKKVAVVSNYTAHDVLKSRYPGLILDVVPDVSTGLAKASLGLVDAYVENMANATYYSQQTGITNLHLAGTTDFDYRWAIGVRNDWPQLRGILNKGLAAIGPDQRKAALARWIGIRETGWRPDRVFVFGTMIAILGLLLAVSAGWNRSLRKAKARALANESRFKTIFQNVGDPVYIAGPSGRIVAANEQASLETGYSPAELLRMKVSDIDATDAAEEVEARFGKIFSERQATFEVQHRRKDGTTFPVEINARAIEYEGRPAVLGVARNLSDRKRIEAALRVSLEKYRVLVESFPLGISITDRNGTIIETNRQAERLVGLARRKQDSDGPRSGEWKTVRPDGTPMPAEEFAAVRALKEERLIRNAEMGIAREGGDVTWLSVTAAPIPLPDHGVAVAYADITDRKRAETEKDQLHSQLQQAVKMEAVGRLAGGVAHDFNNILTAILGNITLSLMKLPPSDPVRALLAEANKAAERASTLTRQLLAFSRKQLIEPKVIDLNDLIANLHSMLVRLIGEDFELQTTLGRELGPVKVDPGQFEQVLVNLAVNARDAMPGGGRLVIETSNVELDGARCAQHADAYPGRFVLLAVSDNGHGMSEEVKSHVFEPFFTTKPTGTGTGLGLAMVYGTVRQAGGFIEVHSELGRGTTFRIFLPRAAEEPSGPQAENPRADLEGGRETVLVVEDEPLVRDLCVEVLRQFGYTVLNVANGREAMALAEAHAGGIDLLVTDVVMPEMNGRVLAKRMAPIHPETKILFTSGYAEDVIVHHGVLEDGVSFLAKPYSPDQLLTKVREVLDGGG